MELRLLDTPAPRILSSTVSTDFAFAEAVNHLDLKFLNEEEKLMRIRNVRDSFLPVLKQEALSSMVLFHITSWNWRFGVSR